MIFDILDLYDQIVAYFQSEGFQKFLLWARLTSFGISSLLVLSLIILLSRSRATWWISERIDSFRRAKLPERMARGWEKIQERLKKEDEASLKLAIIEADNMIDEVLKRMGLDGKDMGERLEKINRKQLSSVDQLWDAHRLKNLIVHQSGMTISKEQAEQAIQGYEIVLKELEII